MIEQYNVLAQYKDYDMSIHSDVQGNQLAVGQRVAVSWSDRRLQMGTILAFTPKKVRIHIDGWNVEKIMFPKAMVILCRG